VGLEHPDCERRAHGARQRRGVELDELDRGSEECGRGTAAPVGAHQPLATGWFDASTQRWKHDAWA